MYLPTLYPIFHYFSSFPNFPKSGLPLDGDGSLQLSSHAVQSCGLLALSILPNEPEDSIEIEARRKGSSAVSSTLSDLISVKFLS